MTSASRLFAALAGIAWFVSFLNGQAAYGNLVAYWNFDETTGDVAANSASTGTVFDGLLRGFSSPGSQWLPAGGRFGGALSFDEGSVTAGNDNVVIVSSTTTANPIDIGATWSTSAWFQTPWPNTNDSVNRWHTLFRGSSDHQLLANRDTDNLGTFRNLPTSMFFEASPIFDMSTLTSPGWSHVVAVGQGGQTTFYVDGNSAGVSGYQSTTDIFSVGNHFTGGISPTAVGGGQRFGNGLDDTGIFDIALTEGEAKSIFTLANEPSLQYSLGEVGQLIEAFRSATGTAIGNLDWRFIDDGSIGGQPGEVIPFVVDGLPSFAVNLNGGNGMALVPVPEPSTLLLAGLAFMPVARRVRKRRRLRQV